MSDNQPQPPFPEQHLSPPGLESKMSPPPRYEAPSYKAAGKLRGKAALITGGDSGIGRAVALLFAREGADVALVYLDVKWMAPPRADKNHPHTKEFVPAVRRGRAGISK